MRFTTREHAFGNLRVRYLRLEGHGSDEEFTGALEQQRQEMLALQREGTHQIQLLDFAASYLLTAKQRRIQADWLRAIDALEREVTRGKAFVSESLLFRGMITAVNWLSPLAVPYTIVAAIEDALVWTFELCERNGVKLTANMRRECRTSLELEPLTDGLAGRS